MLDKNGVGIAPAESLVSQTYRAILDAICDGTLAPDERLNQERLAEALSVSRQPVGQALALLKAQGFVKDAGRRGVVVAAPDRRFLTSMYELRAALDPLGARLAAGKLGEADRERGRELIATGRAALVNGEVHDLVEADAAFHQFVYGLADNPLLIEVMELYWNHLRRAMSEVLRERGQAKRVWDEHQSIFDALVEGRPALAADLARHHVESAAERLLTQPANGTAGEVQA